MSVVSEVRWRVNRAFSEDYIDDETTRDILNDLRLSHRDIEQRIRRSVGTSVLLGVVCALIAAGEVAEASVGFVKLKSVGYLLVGVHVATAYFLYLTAKLISDLRASVAMHDEIIKIRYPSLYENGLESFLVPNSYFERSLRVTFFSRGKGALIFGTFTFFFNTLGALMLPLWVLGLGQFVLAARQDLPTWIPRMAAVITVALAAMAVGEIWISVNPIGTYRQLRADRKKRKMGSGSGDAVLPDA
ncbi:hypothetical protein AB0J90_04215 [Micromonospora sp. NPDC049523]|uniref:hypothetical protein n=1 Tax=Micromonospora sp. NPDC049523 TaxID=3155921 RepID=UPI00343E4AC9